MQCLRPIVLYDIGRKTKNGKRKLSASYPMRGGVADLVYEFPQVLVPCGKCPACLETKRREWCTRMQLELFKSPSASFVTLTYNDEHLPADRLCNKRDVQLFFKRLRQLGRKYHFHFPKIKYFVVSEYGAKYGRPHYHGIFFGVDFSADVWKPYIATYDNERHPVRSSPLLAEAWRNGFVSFDSVTPSSIRYVSKYITKQDANTFRLCSIGLGRDYFVSESGLTSSAIQCAENGFLVLRSRRGFYKVGVPKFLKRYLEKYDPELAERVRLRSQDFCKHLISTALPSVREADIIHQWTEENKKRKYDNEN